MSFILDALKKAESERHRASGPVLVDVRLASPRRGLPVWAWVLGGVLLANLAVLAWMLLRQPAPRNVAAAIPTPSASLATPVTSAAAPAAAPLPAPAPQSSAPPATVAAPADIASLPTLESLQAAGVALPPLLLNLHVYDPSPALRYVLLNGLRLTEGEYTPDGIKVETITEHGVVLDARGQRFLLSAGG